MKIRFLLSIVAALCLLSSQVAQALSPTVEEMAEVRRWVAAKFQGGEATKGAEFFFSFTYDGKTSAEFLGTWESKRVSRELDKQRIEHTLTCTDPKTGLMLRCVGIEYRDFPTVEWTLYFKNTSNRDTPILQDIRSLDVSFDRGDKAEFLLHHAVGLPASPLDYGPLETPLGSGATQRISAAGGRPTNSDMSYFNLQWGGRGAIIVVGWPGQWAAEFVRDAKTGVRVRAGQELTHFRLLPGEEVRTPLMVLQFWTGDYLRSQNLWRRWMMAHSMPKPGGKLPQPQLLAYTGRAYGEMENANEQNQIMSIDRYLEEGFKLDYWWTDAGWYVFGQGQGWPQVGTWEVDRKRFPKGLRAISDHAHSKGMKTLLWFEPERVAAGTWLSKNHPEWILGKNGGLLNLGNPTAWKWLVEHVDKLLVEQGIDLYRQDFNVDPLPYWRAADAPDRQGITEIKHVTGYLAYWDELRRRHPNMLIDSCASGGRRNDLETMRRAVPLWRSDYVFETTGTQCMTYGISFWLPYFGTGTVACDNAPYAGSGFTPVQPYAFWSNAAPSLLLEVDIRVKEARLRRAPQTLQPMARDQPPVQRRLLPADALYPGRSCLDCLAVRPSRKGRGHGAGVPPRRELLRVDPREAARSGTEHRLYADPSRCRRHDENDRSRTPGKRPSRRHPGPIGAVIITYKKTACKL